MRNYARNMRERCPVWGLLISRIDVSVQSKYNKQNQFVCHYLFRYFSSYTALIGVLNLISALNFGAVL